MTRQLAEDQVRMARVRSQRLVGSRVKDVAELVREMVGLQAQDVRAAPPATIAATREVA